MQIKLIFAVHLASFCKWGILELESDLLSLYVPLGKLNSVIEIER